MMKILLFLSLNGFVSAARANYCSDSVKNPRYQKALTSLSEHLHRKEEEVCDHEGLRGVYFAPARRIDRAGEVVPLIRVELIYDFRICQYLVRELNGSVDSEKCYSTW